MTVGLVAFAAGLLFATSASVFSGSSDQTPRDLRGLVAAESQRLDAKNTELEQLREEVATLQSSLVANPEAPTDAEALALGLGPVHGPGVRVALTDAPASSNSDNPDDLVVHQQDLQAVVNALWAGGAEAMSIQGQRVVSTTAVRCVGNVLLLHGRTYSPPYVIEAVGPVSQMVAAVELDAGVRLYHAYVEAFGLGWSMTEVADINLPAYTGSRALNYAQTLEEAA